MKDKPHLVHTPKHSIPVAEVHRTTDGTRVVLCFKKSRSQVYEEIDLWEFVQLVLEELNETDT